MIHTIEFELAKWFKERGVEQNAFFNIDHHCSAFTLCEILEMLPDAISENINNSYWLDFCFRKDEDIYLLMYERICEFSGNKDQVVTFKNKNPAQAAGLLLKWCIENKHVNLNKGEK